MSFGKRYYQRRKYSKGMYAGMGAGAGYYAGSRMNHHGHHYQNSKLNGNIVYIGKQENQCDSSQVIMVIHLLLMKCLKLLMVKLQLYFIVFKKI